MNIREIIDIYNKAETPEVYNRRSNNESTNIKTVVKAIKEQRFSIRSTQNLTDFLHLLKAADSISLDVGTDYLKEFVNISDVATIIKERLTEESLKKIKEIAIRHEKNGQLPNFEKTIAEKDKELANIYLSSQDMMKEKSPIEELKRFDRHIEELLISGEDFSLKTSATKIEDVGQRGKLMLRLGRVMLRQRGMNPGPMEIRDNEVYFEMDVPEPEPIFHGLRQEQGISIAGQEQIKKKQEEQERHKKELEKMKQDKEKQMEENNKNFKMDDEKREKEETTIKQEEQPKVEEQSSKSSFMVQKRKNTPEEQNSARNEFLKQIKCNVRHQNNQNSQKQVNNQTRDMGMSR